MNRPAALKWDGCRDPSERFLSTAAPLNFEDEGCLKAATRFQRFWTHHGESSREHTNLVWYLNPNLWRPVP